MDNYIISGIQQVGIGVANVHEGFKWYNAHFGMDIPIFEEAAEANLMLPYTDIDYCPFNGISYYRLKQTDYHGQVAYSQAVEVNYQILKDGSVIPKTGNLPDEAELKEMENKTILVLMKDKSGKDIVTKIHVSAENNTLIAKDFNENLEQGTYLVLASSYNPLCGQKVLVK